MGASTIELLNIESLMFTTISTGESKTSDKPGLEIDAVSRLESLVEQIEVILTRGAGDAISVVGIAVPLRSLTQASDGIVLPPLAFRSC